MQQRLDENAARGRGTSNRSIASPLAGKLFDADGQPLYVQGATKGRRRYRYYVSKCLVNGSAPVTTERAGVFRRRSLSARWRLPRGTS